jgi:hypothetical protein
LSAAVAHQVIWLSSPEVCGILQVPQDDIQWLVDTGQLTPRVIRNETIFNSLDVWRLIQSYRDVAHRRGR